MSDDITDAELDAMERERATWRYGTMTVSDSGEELIGERPVPQVGTVSLGEARDQDPEEHGLVFDVSTGAVGRYIAACVNREPRLIAALREARRRHAEHERDFACWRVGATEVDASRGAAASLDGTPSRAMIERHFAKCGGHWLVSRVDVGGGSLRPMVLRLSMSVDGGSEWLRATIPGIDYGAPWNDRPFRAMQGAKFTPLTADGEACEGGDK